ncbi:hypothetical protein DINM_004486 [Dirofilaria immitis]|nr:hypothetical protein [Dirofilaria immitis]
MEIMDLRREDVEWHAILHEWVYVVPAHFTVACTICTPHTLTKDLFLTKIIPEPFTHERKKPKSIYRMSIDEAGCMQQVTTEGSSAFLLLSLGSIAIFIVLQRFLFVAL